MIRKIEYHRIFIKKYQNLPKELRIKTAELEKIFKVHPFHPSLQTKPLKGALKGLYSFRITREYRLIYEFFPPDEVLFLNISHRKDIYK